MRDEVTIYSEHLFDSVDSQEYQALPSTCKDRVLRLRSLYTVCVDSPDKADRDLIKNHIKQFGVCITSAYADLKLVRTILGNVHMASKEYHQYWVSEQLKEAYRLAKQKEDVAGMNKALDLYAKYNRVDQPDEVTIDWSRIPTQPFTITFDPTQLGVKPIPNIRKVIDDTVAEFSKGDIVDVEYEEADLNVDIFERSNQDGGIETE